MSKHTPGPWDLDSAKDGDLRYYIVNGQLPQGINGDFGYSLCDTMNRHHCIAPEEDKANALLFAAALEMFSALEMDAAGRTTAELLRIAADHLAAHGGGPVEDCLRLKADQIEAAIRKARGEQ